MVGKVRSTGMPPEGEAGGSEEEALSPADKKASEAAKRIGSGETYEKSAAPSIEGRSVVAEDRAYQRAIEEKQAALWRCIARTPAPYGGHVYTFISKYVHEKNEKWLEIFPAVEPFVRNDQIIVLDSNETLSINSAYKPYERVREYLFKLGYKYDALFSRLYLPDQEALESGWKKLQEELPDLPDLDLLSGDGIANNIEFVEAYLTHDVLLSSGQEFLHDHISHVLPALFSLILPATPEAKESSQSYVSVREELREQIEQKYRRIMLVKQEMENNPEFFISGDMKTLKDHFAQVEYHLGAVVDTLGAESSIGITAGEEYGAFEAVKAFFVKYDEALMHPAWVSKIDEKFGEGASSIRWIKRLHKLCDKVIRDIEERDATPEKSSEDK